MAFAANQEYESANFGGGMGFGGGGMAMILLVVVILWVLFRRDGFDGEHGRDGFGLGGGCCIPMSRPWVPDETVCDADKHLTEKLCKVDEDIHSDGEKTRALIEANYIQDLRDKLSEKNSEVLTLKSEAFTRAQIGGVMGELAEIKCHIPKLRPQYACTVEACATQIPTCEGFPRRGRCDDFCA